MICGRHHGISRVVTSVHTSSANVRFHPRRSTAATSVRRPRTSRKLSSSALVSTRHARWTKHTLHPRCGA